MDKFSNNIPLLIDLVKTSIEGDFYDTIALELDIDSAVELMVINLAETVDGQLTNPIDQDKINMFIMVGNLIVENFLLNIRHEKAKLK